MTWYAIFALLVAAYHGYWISKILRSHIIHLAMYTYFLSSIDRFDAIYILAEESYDFNHDSFKIKINHAEYSDILQRYEESAKKEQIHKYKQWQNEVGYALWHLRLYLILPLIPFILVWNYYLLGFVFGAVFGAVLIIIRKGTGGLCVLMSINLVFDAYKHVHNKKIPMAKLKQVT